MFLREPPRRETRKEVKVALPQRQHAALRAWADASGADATTVVAEALALYFGRIARDAAAPPAARA